MAMENVIVVMQEDRAEFDFIDKKIRNGFIRKVYGILTLQIAVTTGIIALLFFVQPIKDFIQTTLWVLYVLVALSIALTVSSIVPVFYREVTRKFPVNLICIILYTICKALILGIMCSLFDVEPLLLAVGMSGIIVLALTLLALQTKIEFNIWSGPLSSLVLSFIVFGMFAWMPNILNALYAALGAGVLSMYFVINTLLIIEGQRSYSVNPEEYICAALNLYIDIVALILFLVIVVIIILFYRRIFRIFYKCYDDD